MSNGLANLALDQAEQGLREIGYSQRLLRRDYAFADLLSTPDAVRHVPLAAFCQEPPSYRNAAFGVLLNAQDRDIEHYRALGAPQLLQVTDREVCRWKVTSSGAPELLQRIPVDDLLETIRANSAEWGPEPILRARSIAFESAPVQLDFFDAGLLPTLEAAVHKKLDRLLREAIAASRSVYKEQFLEKIDYPKLFRLIFRLLAAKLLSDRGHPGQWLSEDPAEVIKAVENFYFRKGGVESVVEDAVTQRVAWSKIRTAFHLQNISVEALAYIYENTLVDKVTRQIYGTHSTPREVAEYLVHQLPFETLQTEERRVFEPFAGHAALLIAAMGKLRTLLPADLDSESRHAYFVRMIAGIEIDPFAREVARLSLMLADYPNPNGWRLLDGDVFSSPHLNEELKKARIVLCNPPFKAFSREVRPGYADLRSTNKAAEILLRTLERAPDLLGFVLPRPFIDGQVHRHTRKLLTETYREVELVKLPDSAFQHSGVETVLLIAHGKGQRLFRISSTEVSKKDYGHFVETGQATRTETARFEFPAGATTTPVPTLWLQPLQSVWAALGGLPLLGEEADIRNGIYYGSDLSTAAENLVSPTPRPGFQQGLVSVSDGFEPLFLRGHQYLNMADEVMYVRSRAHLFPWDQPKVIVNGARLSGGVWVISGVPDWQGLVVFHNFHAVWPMGSLPLDALAAILNGPIANAFMSVHRTSRHNRIKTMSQIPVPHFRPETMAAITAAVGKYRSARAEWLAQPSDSTDPEKRCRQALYDIDAHLLAAYDLPPKVERELLDYFAGHRRPGPVAFDRYYPEDFRPALPWRMYVSGTVSRASGRATLERLPVLRDPAISEMVAGLG